ncbi:MAG TPA: hypothetical protein VGM32_17245 [Rhodopila sp.]
MDTIAANAIADTIDFVRSKSRPRADRELDRASEDPHVIADIGRLTFRLHAAQALTERAGRAIDAAVADPNEATVTAAQIATAEAKIATTEIAIDASNSCSNLLARRHAGGAQS